MLAKEKNCSSGGSRTRSATRRSSSGASTGWSVSGSALLAGGASSAQPLRLFVDYNTKALHDATDGSRVYAKLDEAGNLTVTELGKTC